MCSEGKQQDEGKVAGEQPDSEIKNDQNLWEVELRKRHIPWSKLKDD